MMGEGGSYQDAHRVYGRAGRALLDVRPGVHPADHERRPLDATSARSASAAGVIPATLERPSPVHDPLPRRIHGSNR